MKHLAGEDDLNMTRLALNMSEYVNGVAKRHAEVSRKMYPGYQVHAITNGVHPITWTADSYIKLYDAHLAGATSPTCWYMLSAVFLMMQSGKLIARPNRSSLDRSKHAAE